MRAPQCEVELQEGLPERERQHEWAQGLDHRQIVRKEIGQLKAKAAEDHSQRDCGTDGQQRGTLCIG